MKNENEVLSRLESIEQALEKILRGNTIIEDEGEFELQVQIDNLELNSKEGVATKEAELLSLADNLEIRFSRFEHRWSCDIFKNCKTWYSGEAFAIDKRNGNMQQWNLIETATMLGNPIPWDYKGDWYKYFQHASHGKFGFGSRLHRDRDISALAKFYADWGWIAWRWYTHA